MNCACCGSSLRPTVGTPRLALQRCPRCGTYRAKHLVQVNPAEPWQSAGVTPTFLQALSERRAIQSRQVIDRFRHALDDGRILDYGCGQGVFVNDLVSHGFDVIGCDLSREVTGQIDRRRFIGLDEPWILPAEFDFRTVILFDVLEHSPNPVGLVGQFRDHGARRLLVKVPLASGPLFTAAKALAHAGYRGVIERLFLVGDVSPHVLYFTPNGLSLLMESAGFRLTSRLSLAEVGRELPARVREIPRSWKLLSSLLSGLGQAAEYLSPRWPDTTVFLFDRTV